MKRPTIRLSLLLAFASLLISLHAQTIVNRNWLMSGGTPNGIYDFQASHVIGSGSNKPIVVVGNTFHAGQAENFLITKYNGDGGLIFKKEYDGTASTTDFATDVTTIGSDIYVTGVEGDTTTGSSYITTLKLDSVGNIVWTAKYQNAYKKYNLGFRIVPDPTNTYLYVCGTSQTGPADFALTLLKYKTIGGSPVWTASYDSVGLYDAGIDLRLSGTTSVLVYGISGLSSTSGDIITRAYNATTGALSSQSRLSGSGAYVTRPVAIAKDNAENIYLAGISNDAGKMDDIVIIKLDSLLNLKWRKYIDGGNSKNDGVSAIKVDTRNNIIMTGWSGNADASKAIWTLKMRDSVIVWDKRRLCAVTGQDAKGLDVDLDHSNNVYVTGTIYGQSRNSQITIAMDSNGVTQWEQFFNNSGNSSDEGRNVKIDSGGGVIVYGRSLIGSTYTYNTMKFESTTLPISLAHDPSGKPFYLQNQMIVDFNPVDIDTGFSGNTGVLYSSLNKILPSSLITTLNAKLGTSVGSWTAKKIYPFITPKVTYSIARNGDTVPVPPLYSHLLVYFPSDYLKSASDYRKMMDSLMSIHAHVEHTELNYCALLNSTPNDYQYFAGQASLHPTSTWPSGHIHAEGAWDLETGKSRIKVGIFDTGIDFRDDDFCFNNFSNCTNRVRDGWNFYSTHNASFDGTPDPISHGTACASIIGAVRNNYTTGHSSDIAGIAGGQYIAGDTANNNNSGVSLYSLNVFHYYGPPYDTLAFGSNTDIATAMEQSTINSDPNGFPWQYGVHIINCSWGIHQDTSSNSFYGIREFHNAVRDVVRNKVTLVASMGNSGDTSIQYPACFYDERVIAVGGSGGYGEFVPASTRGHDIDVTAPYFDALVTALDTGNRVKSFGGTSSSAPHVSGLVALLYSYINTTDTGFNNLEIEDCENLIQKNTVIYPYHNDSIGYGEINASATLHAIQKPHYYIRHYDNKHFPSTLSVQKITSDTLVHLTTYYGDDSGHDAYVCTSCCSGELSHWNTNTHKADIYKVTMVISHNLQPNEVIQDAWVRSNASNLLGNLGSGATIVDRDLVTISNVTHSSATLTAYFYLIKDTATMRDQCWYPLGVADTSTFKLSYSLKIWDGVSTGVQEVKDLGYSISLYPNPSTSSNMLVVELDKAQPLQIDLFDIQGKLIRTVYNGGGADGVNHFKTDIQDLMAGVYLYRVQGDGFVRSIKFTKY